MRSYFEAYATSDRIRAIIDERRYTASSPRNRPSLSQPSATCRRNTALIIPDYVKDYVSLNRFAPYP